MCDCIKEICYKIKEAGGYVNVDPPVELLSGRVYLSFSLQRIWKEKDKGNAFNVIQVSILWRRV